jgi:UDP:flavonoid glycosyltransferase YjiC (YdhE family)
MKIDSLKKRILVCPLDWGLGHASRCIPIIHELDRFGFEVVIAADRAPLQLLKNQFPDKEFITYPGPEIEYPKRIGMALFMLLKAPNFIKWLKDEQSLLESFIDSYQIDAVISDNRYGSYSSRIPSILMTHQLFIQAPMGKRALKAFTAGRAKNFDETWVPDFDGADNLSGDLSHGETDLEELHYIGPISRFTGFATANQNHTRDLTIVLSGPEPTRTQFEEIILKQINSFEGNVLLVRGLPETINPLKLKSNIEVKSFLPAKELEVEMANSKHIVCRSGYSSIMDLAALGKNAILVPTPGQTEQEYLAEKLKKEGKYYFENQKDFNLDRAILASKDYTGVKYKMGNAALRKRIQLLSDRLNYSK